MAEEYKRTCEDELDWTDIGQLHDATLQISKSCFEFKKLCVGLIGAALAVLVKLTDSELDYSYFAVPLLICLGFWVADLTAYYYQRSTRKAMDKKLRAIAKRNSLTNYGRNDIEASWFGAAFNLSMSLYYVLACLGAIGWVAYAQEWIGS